MEYFWAVLLLIVLIIISGVVGLLVAILTSNDTAGSIVFTVIMVALIALVAYAMPYDRTYIPEEDELVLIENNRGTEKHVIYDGVLYSYRIDSREDKTFIKTDRYFSKIFPQSIVIGNDRVKTSGTSKSPRGE